MIILLLLFPVFVWMLLTFLPERYQIFTYQINLFSALIYLLGTLVQAGVSLRFGSTPQVKYVWLLLGHRELSFFLAAPVSACLVTVSLSSLWVALVAMDGLNKDFSTDTQPLSWLLLSSLLISLLSQNLFTLGLGWLAVSFICAVLLGVERSRFSSESAPFFRINVVADMLFWLFVLGSLLSLGVTDITTVELWMREQGGYPIWLLFFALMMKNLWIPFLFAVPQLPLRRSLRPSFAFVLPCASMLGTFRLWEENIALGHPLMLLISGLSTLCLVISASLQRDIFQVALRQILASGCFSAMLFFAGAQSTGMFSFLTVAIIGALWLGALLRRVEQERFVRLLNTPFSTKADTSFRLVPLFSYILLLFPALVVAHAASVSSLSILMQGSISSICFCAVIIFCSLLGAANLGKICGMDKKSASSQLERDIPRGKSLWLWSLLPVCSVSAIWFMAKREGDLQGVSTISMGSLQWVVWLACALLFFVSFVVYRITKNIVEEPHLKKDLPEWHLQWLRSGGWPLFYFRDLFFYCVVLPLRHIAHFIDQFVEKRLIERIFLTGFTEFFSSCGAVLSFTMSGSLARHLLFALFFTSIIIFILGL